MKFGLWYDFRNPQRQPWSDLYGELLDQIEWADSAGFESAWLSEHHVTDDGYMPSVFVMLAAIASRTRKLRLGTAVCLAPLHHPRPARLEPSWLRHPLKFRSPCSARQRPALQD